MKIYLAGQWQDGQRTMEVRHPYDGSVVDTVPVASPEQVEAAVAAAVEGAAVMRRMPGYERYRILRKAAELVQARQAELARTLSLEVGKTLPEAAFEVSRAVQTLEVSAEEAKRIGGEVLPLDGAPGTAGKLGFTLRVPCGVVLAITPFNFPLMVPLWFLPTAITCGNTFIVKPSPQTPMSMVLLFEILDELGLPEGVVNLVLGGKEASMAVMEHPGIVGVSFVGSTPVAKLVYETCAKHGKRVQAQGGAKNYIAVMPDADISASAANIMGSAFGCAGQRCLAGSVVVAVGEAYEPLRDELVKRAAALRVGYGMDETTQMGTVISAAARERIESMIAAGVSEGAELLLDGRGAKIDGYEQGSFVRPTILDKVTPEMSVAREEIFGPVLSIIHVPDFDSAIEVINKSRYGNAASLFTTSGKAAREFKYRVNAGNIGINIGVAAATASFPFGGQKESFFCDLHGQGLDSIEFFTDKKILIERW